MALVACAECKREISDKAASCPHCGAPSRIAQGREKWGYDAPVRPPVFRTAKSRGVYVALGLFFGMLGVHNFYAGRIGVAVAQMLCTLILGWFVIGLFITGIWVIVELFVVKADGSGEAFA